MKAVYWVVLLGLALAQQVPVPPTRPPDEPWWTQVLLDVRLEGRPRAGMRIDLLPGPDHADRSPITRITDADGRASWREIPKGSWSLRLLDPTRGLDLRAPLNPCSFPILYGDFSVEWITDSTFGPPGAVWAAKSCSASPTARRATTR
ncbi:MAG: hypothetical protein SFU83_10640 [Meiothermus sp.]|nr:hypothetical protein [Meiothermus sp.]